MPKDNLLRDSLADMFAFISFKVRNGSMNLDDIKCVLTAIGQAGGVKATVKDLAEFYGKSEDGIRHVINRNFMPKPVRRVYYDFGAFMRVVPKVWSTKASPSDS